MTDTCNICVETFSTRAPKLECMSCGFLSCCKCVLRYVEESENEPRCMQCLLVFSRGFMFDYMSKTMNKRLVNHNAEIAVKRQMAMLPSTIHYAKLISNSEENEIKARDFDAKANVLLKEARSLREINATIKHDMLVISGAKSGKHVPSGIIHVARCMKDTCRGFVEQGTFQCGLCATNHCESCLEISDADHVCDKDLIASIKTVREFTKPCPSCCAPIHKIDGCNDMFCVVCKTAFCWRTMNVHTSGNSNPLYFKWMQANQVQRRQIGTTDPVWEFSHSEFAKKIPEKLYSNIMYVIQNVKHHETVLLDQVRKTSEDVMRVKEMDVRAKFLNRKIDEAGFKRNIKRFQADVDHTRMIGYMTSGDGESIMKYALSKENDWSDPKTDVKLHDLVTKINNSAEHVSKVFGRLKHHFIPAYSTPGPASSYAPR